MSQPSSTDKAPSTDKSTDETNSWGSLRQSRPTKEGTHDFFAIRLGNLNFSNVDGGVSLCGTRRDDQTFRDGGDGMPFTNAGGRRNLSCLQRFFYLPCFLLVGYSGISCIIEVAIIGTHTGSPIGAGRETEIRPTLVPNPNPHCPVLNLCTYGNHYKCSSAIE